MIIRKNIWLLLLVSLILLLPTTASTAGPQDLDETERQMLELAFRCRKEIVAEFEKMLAANDLTVNQLFDTFYIPIPGTSPQKFTTQYDKLTDERLRILLDSYLEREKRLLYVVATDRNGYVPTHNSRYSMPLTEDAEYNAKNNRTKRLFNDRTGLAAAKNTAEFLLQEYNRDTGEMFYDISAPIFLMDKHWGAIRVGFTK